MQQKERWVVAAKRADFNQIAKEFSIDPVIARIIRNRDVIGTEQIKKYLSCTKEDLYSPWLFHEMEKMIQILSEKIQEKAKIRIIGDYDVDGIMSAYILEHGLKTVGADVDVMIPRRIEDGYGLNVNLITQAKEDGKDTIITCDNGITAFEQIKLAKELGMTVLVTDHHLVVEETLPVADAIIDPKVKDCGYPYSDLCGAAVAYKVIDALYEKHNISKNLSDDFLEYVAFATIEDSVPLVDENRTLVKLGMEHLHATKNCGLRELMRATNLEPRNVGTYEIGYILGPCINASGRLETALKSLELLRSNDEEIARQAAIDLKHINDSRKDITQEGVKDAISYIEEHGIQNDKVYVIYLPDCHESLAGIIAGRIKGKYNHPTWVITKAKVGAKGSGRSIEEYNLVEALTECKDILANFGGHKMAAGLSLNEEDIPILRQRLNDNCTLEEEDFLEKVVIDVPMPMSYVTMDFINQLDLIEPSGMDNPKPIFAQKDLKALNYRIIGKNQNVISMQLDDGNGHAFDAIAFYNTDALLEILKNNRRFSALYYPNVNRFNGKETIQMVITNVQESAQ